MSEPAAPAAPVLILDGVIKDYGTEVVTRAVSGVSFSIAVGELVALIGPSGSGKSTLLNLLGLLDQPTAGTITLMGERADLLEDAGRTRLRGRALGFVFQFHHLIPSLTAEENVAMPLAIDAGRIEPEHKKRARILLAAVGLGDKIRSKPSQLSGGQQQRVAIARALVRKPPLVLADEPTGALDSGTSHEVFTLMRHFHEVERTSFIIVTHDPRIAEKCDRVIEIADGRIVRDTGAAA